MRKETITEIEMLKNLFSYEGDPPFCFKKAYFLLRETIAFINKLGLKGEFLLELHPIERRDVEILFISEEQNPASDIRKRMKEMGL